MQDENPKDIFKKLVDVTNRIYSSCKSKNKNFSQQELLIISQQIRIFSVMICSAASQQEIIENCSVIANVWYGDAYDIKGVDALERFYKVKFNQ